MAEGRTQQDRTGRFPRGGALWLSASLLLHLMLLGLLPPPVEALEAAAAVLQIELQNPPPLPPVTESIALPAPVETPPVLPVASAEPPRQQKSEPATANQPVKPQVEAPNPQPAESTNPQVPAGNPAAVSDDSDFRIAAPRPAAQPAREDKPASGPDTNAAETREPSLPPAEPAKEPAAPLVDVKALLKAYGAGVQSAIRARQFMPAEAERLKLSGSVTLGIAIGASGELLDVSVVGSSGHSSIDEAALEAVRDAAPFEPLPAESGRSKALFSFTLKYSHKAKE